MKKILSTTLLLLIFFFTKAQNIGVGTINPHQSAALDITDTSKGILIPRMTMIQRNNIQNPAEGLMVYQTDSSKGFWYYSEQTWLKVSTSINNSSNNTTDSNSLIFTTSGF